MAIDYGKGKAADLPNEDELSTISKLAEEQVRLEEKIKDAEEKVKALKSAHFRVRTESLPEAMKQVGLSEFTLSNGAKITVKDDYNVTISVANKPAAFNWLRENGHGDIIKNEVVLSFGMFEDSEKDKAIQIAEESGFTYAAKEAVHAGTLKAWAKAQFELQLNDDAETREKGSIPEELITVFRLAVSKVTLPKKKR